MPRRKTWSTTTPRGWQAARTQSPPALAPRRLPWQCKAQAGEADDNGSEEEADDQADDESEEEMHFSSLMDLKSGEVPRIAPSLSGSADAGRDGRSSLES